MKPYQKILLWTPRILFIIAILFISMFAFDAFSPERNFWQNTAALLMHLLPSFVLVALLVVAWKRELTGGILITILGLAATPVLFNLNSQRHSTFGETLGIVLMLTLPFIITGILFIVSHYVNRRHKSGEPQS